MAFCIVTPFSVVGGY